MTQSLTPLIAALVFGSFDFIAQARPLRSINGARRNRMGERQTIHSSQEDPKTRQIVTETEFYDFDLKDGFSLDIELFAPSEAPSADPSSMPTDLPSLVPNYSPSQLPSIAASLDPTPTESNVPSFAPTAEESIQPSSVQGSSAPDGNSLATTIPSSENPSHSPSSSEIPTGNSSMASSFIETTSLFPSLFITLEEGQIESPLPSSSPTLGKCLVTPEERASQILTLLEETLDVNTTLDDLETPQGQATNWLVNQDFGQYCPDPKIVQRWALALVYFSTNLDDWVQCSPTGSDFCGLESPFEGKKRFLSESSECEWAGITCNEEDCVTKIVFENNGLNGTIPTELGLLTDLAVLGMERGGLSSTIPTEIGGLENLIFIDLDFNQLTGSIPTELFLLTNLQTLDLNDNFLTGNIESISVFGDLEFLQLQTNEFTGTVPEAMGLLTRMTTFNIHENLFTGSMPESVCALRNTTGGLLKSLIADCAASPGGELPEMECNCCTSCRWD